MSQADAQAAVLQAIQQGELSPYGNVKVQMQDTTGYVALPIDVVTALDIGQGQQVQRGYHPPTGCVVISTRDDVDLFKSQ